MQPNSQPPAGRLSHPKAAAQEQHQGRLRDAHGHFKTVKSVATKHVQAPAHNSMPNSLRAGASTTTSSRSTPPAEVAAGLAIALPSLEGLKLLLARYPAFGPALSALEWDEHGRISKHTLLRILTALDGNRHDLVPPPQAPAAAPSTQQDTQAAASFGVPASPALQEQQPMQPQGQAQGTAPSQGPNPCADTPSSRSGDAQDTAHASTAAGTAGTAAGVLAQAPAQPVTRELCATNSVAVPAQHDAACVAPSCNGASTAVVSGSPRHTAEAAVTAAPSSGAADPAAAAAATAILGACAGAGPCSTSSAGSSRRTSLRPTLSIDISSLHVSDSSSDSSSEGDGSSTEEPKAPAVHAAAGTGTLQPADGGASAAGHAADLQDTHAGEKYRAAPPPAAAAAVTSSDGHSSSKRKHCSTPGYVLHQPMQFFDNPVAATSSEEEEQEEGAASAGGSGAAAIAAEVSGSICRHSETSDSDNTALDHHHQQQQQQQLRASCGSGRKKKAQTPATGLGKPVSIFSGSSGVADACAAHSHGQHSAQPSCKEEGEQPHSWEHKLSKRPLTPGVSLSQPVSIFSGSSSSRGQHDVKHRTSCDGSQEHHGHSTAAEQHVGFVEPSYSGSAGHHTFSGSSHTSTAHDVPVTSTDGVGPSVCFQLPGRPQSAPGLSCRLKPDKHTQGVRWRHKLSQRPPTPGLALGQPVSIFSEGRPTTSRASGSQDSTHSSSSSRGCSSHDDESCSDGSCSEQRDRHEAAGPHKQQQGMQQQQGVHKQHHQLQGSYQQQQGTHQHLVTFEDEHSASAAELPTTSVGSSNGSRCWSAPPRPVPLKAAPRHLQQTGRQQEQQPQHHRSSKRPATPGASLGKPVSIFSSSSSSGSNNIADHCVEPHTAEGTVRFADPQCANPTVPRAPDAGHAAFQAPQQQQGQQQQQHSWHHKLSKRPPTPGVSLGQPVSIFAGGNSGSSHGRASEGRRSSDGAAGSVHFAAADAAIADSTCSGAAPPGNAQQQQVAQHRHPHRAPTPGYALGQTRSIFSDDGTGEEAAVTAAAAAAAAAAVGAGHKHDAGQSHPSQGASQGQCSDSATHAPLHYEAPGQHTGNRRHSGSHRVSWSDEPQLGLEVPGNALHEQHFEAQHQKWTAGRAAGAAAAATGSCTQPCNASSAAGTANTEVAGRRITWADDWSSPGTSTAGASSTQAAAAPAAAALPGASATCNNAAPSAGHAAAATVPALAAATVQDQSIAASSAAVTTGHIGLQCLLAAHNSEIAAEVQQQRWQQHLAARPPTPGAPLQAHHNIFADSGREGAAACSAGGSSGALRSYYSGMPASAPGVSLALSGPRGASAGVSTAAGVASAAKQVLLKQHPELAEELQQQQWQQHMANRPPTPGASLLPHNNIFADGPEGQEEADEGGSDGGSSSEVQGDLGYGAARPASSTAAAKQALLKQHPELAAEAQQQKWQRHMANRPPTPGASLLPHNNIFADGPEGQEEADEGGSDGGSSSEVQGDLGYGAARPASSTAAAKQALLKQHPELAEELQQQKWQRHMAARPPTLGASLLPHHNIFADGADDEADPEDSCPGGAAAAAHTRAAKAATAPAGAATAATAAARAAAAAHASTAAGPGTAATALVLHNSDLALDREQQWQLKLSKRPPTPAAHLAKPFNMFEDDGSEQGQPAGAAPALHDSQRQGYGSSSSSNSGDAQASAAAVAPATTNGMSARCQSPDQARLHTGGSSTGPRGPAEPQAGPPNGQPSTKPNSRPGSNNPGRQRGSSPLRNTTTAADAAAEDGAVRRSSPLRNTTTAADAAAEDGAVRRSSPLRNTTTAAEAAADGAVRRSSPLRNTTTAAEAAAEAAAEQDSVSRHSSPLSHSSSQFDPDPALTRSPLGRRSSNSNAAPQAQSVTQSPVLAAAAAATAERSDVGMHPARHSGVGSEACGSSRLGRSAAVPPAAEGVHRAGSPLSRNSSSGVAGGQRHGSPLSRSSNDGR